MRYILIPALMLATPAAAQINTRCSFVGNRMNCNSAPAYTPLPAMEQVDIPRALQAYERGRQARAEQEARQQLQAQQEAQAQQALAAQQRSDYDREESMAMRREAGRMIREGKCDDAMGYMLDHGRLDLANEVKILCAKP